MHGRRRPRRPPGARPGQGPPWRHVYNIGRSDRTRPPIGRRCRVLHTNAAAQPDVVVASTQRASARAGFVPLGVHLVGSVPLSTAAEVFSTLGAGLGDRLQAPPRRRDRATRGLDRLAVPGSQLPGVVRGRAAGAALVPSAAAPAPPPRRRRARPRVRAARLRRGGRGVVPRLRHAQARRRSAARLQVPGLAADTARARERLRRARRPVRRRARLRARDARRPRPDAGGDPTRPARAAMGHELRVRDARRRRPRLVPGRPGRDPRAAPADQQRGAVSRRARLPLLLGPRRGAPRARCRATSGASSISRTRSRPASSGRSRWIHMPVPPGAHDEAFFAPLAGLRLQAATELYLGLIHPGESEDDARRAIAAAHAADTEFGIATPCGWGRLPQRAVAELVAAHAALSRPVADPSAEPGYVFAWPDDFERVPDEQWVEQPVDEFGLHYDTVENHGWYRNLDPTVEQLAADLREGEVLVDYSGGTGILLDRLRLRIFDRQVGMVIVDSSPKFLRVAVERLATDERVAFRRLRFLREERRLEYVDEALGPTFPGADHLVSTNAIHLYDDLDGTPWPRGRAWCGRAAASVSTRATCATRAPRRTSGSSTRPCTSSTRWRPGSFAPIRAGPRTATCSTTRSASRHTSTGATACSSRRGRSTTTSTRCGRPGSGRRRLGADDRGERRGVVRVPRRLRRRRARLGRRVGEGRRRGGLGGGGGGSPRPPAGVSEHDLRRQADLPLLLDLHHCDAHLA